jgi:hypothetical protein
MAVRFGIPPGEVGQRFTAKETSQINAYDLILCRQTEDDIAQARLKLEAQRVRKSL